MYVLVTRGTSSLLSSVLPGWASFGFSLAFPFVFWGDGSGHQFLLEFFKKLFAYVVR
jgi:hypothetical protein